MFYQKRVFIEELLRRNALSPEKEYANRQYKKRCSFLNSIINTDVKTIKRESKYLDRSILPNMLTSIIKEKSKSEKKNKNNIIYLTTSTNICLINCKSIPRQNLVFKKKEDVVNELYFKTEINRRKIKTKVKSSSNTKKQLTPFEKGKNKKMLFRECLTSRQRQISNLEAQGKVLTPFTSLNCFKTVNNITRRRNRIVLLNNNTSNNSESKVHKDKIKKLKVLAYFNSIHLKKKKKLFHFNSYLD